MGNIFSSENDSIKGGNGYNFVKKITEILNNLKNGKDVNLFTGIQDLKELLNPNITQERASEISAKIALSPFGQFCNDLIDNVDPKKEIRNKYFNSDTTIKGNNETEKKDNLTKFVYEVILGLFYIISKSSKSTLSKIFGSDELNDILESDKPNDEKFNIIMDKLQTKSKISGGYDVVGIVAVVVILVVYIASLIVLALAMYITIIAIVAITAITIIVVVIVLVLLLIYICATLPILIYMMRDKNTISDEQHAFMVNYMKKYNDIVDYIFKLLNKALDSPKYITDISKTSINSISEMGNNFVTGVFAALTSYLNFMSSYINIKGIGGGNDGNKIIQSEQLSEYINSYEFEELLQSQYYSDCIDKINSGEYNEYLNKLWENNDAGILFEKSKQLLIKNNEKLVDKSIKSKNPLTDALLMYSVFLVSNINSVINFIKTVLTTGKISKKSLDPNTFYTSTTYSETYNMIKSDLERVINCIIK